MGKALTRTQVKPQKERRERQEGKRKVGRRRVSCARKIAAELSEATKQRRKQSKLARTTPSGRRRDQRGFAPSKRACLRPARRSQVAAPKRTSGLLAREQCAKSPLLPPPPPPGDKQFARSKRCASECLHFPLSLRPAPRLALFSPTRPAPREPAKRAVHPN